MQLITTDLSSEDGMNRKITDQEDPLLLTLEESSKLVAHTRDPAETMENIVELISSRFKADVCSVYFLESSGTELVLGATVGLRKESIGKVKLKTTEGLVGLVAETLRPVMVANAFSHPRFKYIPESGEDPYLSFLGVPLVKAGGLVGVLVIQTEESRSFSINEIRNNFVKESMLSSKNYINHIMYSPNDKKYLFFNDTVESVFFSFFYCPAYISIIKMPVFF